MSISRAMRLQMDRKAAKQGTTAALHRDFGWAAIPQGEQNPSDYYRMARFARAVTAEMVQLGDLTSREIRDYMERAKEETGISFEYS